MKEENEKLLKKTVSDFTQAQQNWFNTSNELSAHELKWADSIKEYEQRKKQLEENYEVSERELDRVREEYKRVMSDMREDLFKHETDEIKKEQLEELKKVKEFYPETTTAEEGA